LCLLTKQQLIVNSGESLKKPDSAQVIYKLKRKTRFIRMCKTDSKVAHIKQQKMFLSPQGPWI